MNIKSFVSLAAAIALFLLSVSLQAETINASADLQTSKKMNAYVFSHSLAEAMYRLGVAQDKKLGLQLDCRSQYSIKPVSTTVLSPIDFPDDKQHPIKGVWEARFQLERCGSSKVYNVVFVANSNGEAPTPHQYYPGSTNASPLLVKDAMPSALAGAQARSRVKDCKDIDVFDMQVTEQAHDVVEGDKRFKRVWKETWTFVRCGQMIDVPITFIPDETGGGTSFETDPVKVMDIKDKP